MIGLVDSTINFDSNKMTISEVEFAGFKSLELKCADQKMIVTTDVGPRILWYSRKNGSNHLYVKKEHEGLKDGVYHSYGGHRMWIAPEDKLRTYTPDSFPVKVVQEKQGVILTCRTDEFGITKSLRISPTNIGFQIDHWFSNTGSSEARFAPWAVTVMRSGGVLSVPLHELRPQSENLLPVTPLVLWGYTDLTDERFQITSELLKLRQLPIESPTKFGAFLDPGIAAYSNDGETFIKSWKSTKNLEYPDLGCNFESYTRHDMLEVESLGHLQCVGPGGDSAIHTEFWTIASELVPSHPTEARMWLISRV
jgi:hypothetical protein